MKYSIKTVGEHIEVYDWFGRFQFSADTEEEAWADLQELLEHCA